MAFRSFGRAQQRKRTEIDTLLEKVKKIDSVSAQILLREAYEVSYEIATPEEINDHPWGLALARPKENYTDYGTLYRTIHAFRLREVYKRFGLSLEDFLALPREYVEMIFDITRKEALEGQNTLDNLREELGDNIPPQ